MPVTTQAPHFCEQCGAQLGPTARYCAACGSPSGPEGSLPVDPTGVGPNQKPIGPWPAAICSLLIAGLGQMLLGQAAKGVLILLLAIVIGALTAGLAIVVIWPAAAIDAYCIAKKLRAGATVHTWEFF